MWEDHLTLPILILNYRGRSVAVHRRGCSTPKSTISEAKKCFQALRAVPEDELVLLAPIPEFPEAGIVEVKGVWDSVWESTHSVTIARLSELEQGSTTSSTQSTRTSSVLSPSSEHTYSSPWARQWLSPRSDDVIHVTFSPDIVPSPDSFDVREPGLLEKKVSYLEGIIHSRAPGVPGPGISRELHGNVLWSDKTLSSCGLASGDTVIAVMVFRGRKPVIYLYPPSKFQDVSVQLSLAPSWSFSAVYPPPQTGSATAAAYQGTQSITWLVTADPSGRLVNKPIGTEVSYLYWEARSSGLCITPEPSRSSSPVAHAEIFEPMRPVLSPGDSVFLPKSEVPGYLDATLKTLGLHTEARTSFITYWLPNILEHEYIALRFLAQEAYEAAARLDVSPAPDVVTRVFMLFRGVASSDLAFWEPAIARAEDDINFWVDVVGVDPVRASNPALFRVLEWGGMEVR